MRNSTLTVLISFVLSAFAPNAFGDLGTLVGVSACATVTTVSYCVYRACQTALIKKASPNPYDGLLAAVETVNELKDLSKISLDAKIRGAGRPEGPLTLTSPQQVLSALRSKPHVFAIDPDRWPVVVYPRSLSGGWLGWNLNLGLYVYRHERVILAVAKEVLGDVTINYLSRDELANHLTQWQTEFLQKTGTSGLSFTLKDSLQLVRADLLRSLQRYQVAVQVEGEATPEVEDAAYLFLLTRMANSIRVGHQRSDRAYEFGFSEDARP